jgi:hypothetical protein
MNTSCLTSNPISLIVYGSFGFFLFFLLFVILFRTASGKESYSNINRAHKIFFLLFLGFSSFIYLTVKVHVPVLDFLVALLLGTFIFFSLHYVYFFALVGLIKKSISVNILSVIFQMNLSRTDLSTLKDCLQKSNLDFESIRKNRLEQMTYLKFALKNGNEFTITPKGVFTNNIGNLIFKIWGLKRL